MGVLVDVDSETFLLPKKHFNAAMRALEALAVESPSSYVIPKSVAGSEDLEEALAAAFWHFEKSENGDLVALSYGADKGPDSDSWPGTVLEALAPFVTNAKIVYRVEGDSRETVYTIAKGKVSARTRKRTKPKSAPEPEVPDAGAWIVAPPDSFGIDWRGENDWDGDRGGGGNRSPERWQFERKIWANVVEHLRRRGISINRLGLVSQS